MKISPIIVFGFLFIGLAFFSPLNAQDYDAQIAQLKQEIASLKSTIKQMEKDYYEVLLKNMKRQNSLRAEIRRLKEELENAGAKKVDEKVLVANSNEVPASITDTYDKDLEYKEAQALRMTRERETAQKEENNALQKIEAKEEPQNSKEEKSSFWDHAFPF